MHCALASGNIIQSKNNKLSCCYDSRSYCVMRMTYSDRLLSGMAVVSLYVYLLIYSFGLKSAFGAKWYILLQQVSDEVNRKSLLATRRYNFQPPHRPQAPLYTSQRTDRRTDREQYLSSTGRGSYDRLKIDAKCEHPQLSRRVDLYANTVQRMYFVTFLFVTLSLCSCRFVLLSHQLLWHRCF